MVLKRVNICIAVLNSFNSLVEEKKEKNIGFEEVEKMADVLTVEEVFLLTSAVNGVGGVSASNVLEKIVTNYYNELVNIAEELGVCF